MKKSYPLEIDTDQPMDELAAGLALYLSVIFRELFPDRWDEGMTELASAIGRHVRLVTEDRHPRSVEPGGS